MLHRSQMDMPSLQAYRQHVCQHRCHASSSSHPTAVPRAGLSNIITSLTGAGLTGSYIFSQTLFSMRAGVHTKLHGWIIAGTAACQAPHHLCAAVTKFDFAATCVLPAHQNQLPGSLLVRQSCVRCSMGLLASGGFVEHEHRGSRVRSGLKTRL